MIHSITTLKLLVVEDNEGDFIIIEELLSEEIKSPVIIRATSQKEAIDLIEKKIDFDVVLLDLTLPDASGEKVVNSILKIVGQIPVIVLTGYTDKKFAIKTLSLGISDYIQKDGLNAIQLSKSIEYSIERKKSLLQLKESEEKYRNLFHLSPLPMWVYDIETLRFLDVNKAAINHYGYSKEDFLSMSVLDMRLAEDFDKLKIAIQKLLNSTDNYFKGFTRHIKKNGELMDIEIQGNVIEFNNRKAILNLANDITEKLAAEKKLKASEEALKILNAELEERVSQRTSELMETNKNLESFSYAVSHDLQAPLRIIAGFAQLLYNKHYDCLDNEGKDYVKNILGSTTNMQVLIKNMLNFSRIGRAQIKKEQIDMNEIITFALKSIPYNEEHVSINVAKLPKVNADKHMIVQVIQNLLSNAIKYSSKKPNSIIEVGAKENEHEVIFHVKDNGCGFDMKFYSKLFGMFQRLHTVTEYEGSGVGLSTIKLIIEKHNGKIWAESILGEGATFYFSLPK